jgi:SagB-type dehydrogenase family enzyme
MVIYGKCVRSLVGIFLLTLVSTSCAADQQQGTQVSSELSAIATTPLPAPRQEGELSLEEALLQRRSIRSFSETPLTPAEIGQILWAAQGITNARGFRTTPSAGALYPLEVYIVCSEGVYHYNPQAHALIMVLPDNQIQSLYEVALEQQAILEAPLTLVITAVFERTAAKYGAERSPRYVHLEAGHAAQNTLLQSVSLGLAAVPIGAFNDAQVQTVLGLPEDHQPLYLIPIGYPR